MLYNAVGDSFSAEAARRQEAVGLKAVYEVDPLKCPKCGGTMKIVGFIEEVATIEKILRHCNLWKEAPRPPPVVATRPPVTDGPTLDYTFFEQNCV